MDKFLAINDSEFKNRVYNLANKYKDKLFGYINNVQIDEDEETFALNLTDYERKVIKEFSCLAEKTPEREDIDELLKLSLIEPKLVEDILSLRRYFIKKYYDNNYPDKPYYRSSKYNIFDLDWTNQELTLQNQIDMWEISRQDNYTDQKNVIFDKDYTTELLKCAKYPVVGEQVIEKDGKIVPVLSNRSLDNYLTQLKHRLSNSIAVERPKIDDIDKTFIQIMFAKGDHDELIKFRRIVEIKQDVEQIKENVTVPIFHFTVTVQVLPDDDPDHYSFLFRINSKKSKHHPILVKDDNLDERANSSFAYHKKMYDRLYNIPTNVENIRLYDRLNQLIYLNIPHCANSITLTHLLNLQSQPYKDISAITPMVAEIICNDKIMNNISEVMKKSALAQNKIDAPRLVDRKQAWMQKYYMLENTLKIVDELLNIQPEREAAVVEQIVANDIDMENDYKEDVSNTIVTNKPAVKKNLNNQHADVKKVKSQNYLKYLVEKNNLGKTLTRKERNYLKLHNKDTDVSNEEDLNFSM